MSTVPTYSLKDVVDDLTKMNVHFQERVSMLYAEREKLEEENSTLMRYQQFLLEKNLHLDFELKELVDECEFQRKVNERLHDDIQRLHAKLNDVYIRNNIENLDN